MMRLHSSSCGISTICITSRYRVPVPVMVLLYRYCYNCANKYGHKELEYIYEVCSNPNETT
jgi:hypothetical protein